MRKEKKPSAEKSGNEVCSLKETVGLYRRAIAVWCSEYPKLFLYTWLYTLVKACSPCFSLYFTAKLLNELAGQRRGEELVKWAVIILISAMVLSFLRAVLFRAKETFVSIQWTSTDIIYSPKMLVMD